MSNDSAPEDRPNRRAATLDFIIQSLKEHEQNLDALIAKLMDIKQQIDDTKEVYNRFEEIEVSMTNLEKEIKRLTSYISASQK
ncbi:MAG: hypothetical protein ACQCN6_09820 [Candidatus Bathyarchaeia archaeon]|jgi:peptidoglycan hydrolase CwlO-like protein